MPLDQNSFDNAMAVYGGDFNIPINGVHYEVPSVFRPWMKDNMKGS